MFRSKLINLLLRLISWEMAHGSDRLHRVLIHWRRKQSSYNFHFRLFYHQLRFYVDRHDFSGSITKLNEMSGHFPDRIQQIKRSFTADWCTKIHRMLEAGEVDQAALLLRSLYLLTRYDKNLDKLIAHYFEYFHQQTNFASLNPSEKLTVLSMQSQYYYQAQRYLEAEQTARQFFSEVDNNFTDKINSNLIWSLVQRCLKSIKNKHTADGLLSGLLLNMKTV